MHAAAHGLPVDTARVAFVGIVVVVEALLPSTVDLGIGCHSPHLICRVFFRHHSNLGEVLRSWKHRVTLDRFHLALLGSGLRGLGVDAFLWASRVPLQILVEGSLFLWVGERTAKDQPLQDGPGHWEGMNSPL